MTNRRPVSYTHLDVYKRQAIDDWVARNVSEDRAVVPIGFSQGGLLAIQLLRVHPERYAASISLSGFLAPGIVAGSAPADSYVAELNIPVFYGYGKNDTVIPMPELFAAAAWLDEHTFLTSKSYRGDVYKRQTPSRGVRGTGRNQG